MLQIILILAVASVAAYFITTSKKSKVEEVSKDTPEPTPVKKASVKAKVEPIVEVQKVVELKEAKKVIKKKAAPKKKATK